METKKIISMNKTKCEAIEFNSANDLIHVKITEDNGPVLVLEDGSIVILSDVSMYFSLISSGVISNNTLNIIITMSIHFLLIKVIKKKR